MLPVDAKAAEGEAISRIAFRGLTVAYDGRVLEPRPWTGAQSAWAAELLADAPAGAVLELCAGVGHIGLGSLHDSARNLVMVDLNPVAERFALANAEANGLAGQVEFRLGRMEEVLAESERFPLIIADPPWVRSDDTGTFPDDPLSAIDGGDDGLALARTCVELIGRHLAEGGAALLQLGNAEQAQTIAAHAERLPEGSINAVERRSYDGGVVVRLER